MSKTIMLTPKNLFNILYQKLGKQYWWPMDIKYHEINNSDPRFEIITGTILTQNTAWSNVEKALNNLKSEKMLEIKKISDIDLNHLQMLIKPSGFFNQKAERLKKLACYFYNNYNCNLDSLFKKKLSDIRSELLSLNGIGPETADSILLYAGNKPIFVVDSYTKRICRRLPMKTKIIYNDIQNFFEKDLHKHYSDEKIVQIFNELHALIVIHAKNYCKKKPKCKNCPLQKHCMFTKELS